MSSNTAEQAIAHQASEAPLGEPVLPRAASDIERALAARDVWRALWASRLIVWIAGVGSVLALGFGPVRNAFDPPGITRGFGWLGDLLAAPAARWDAAWYLVIAHFGYRADLGSLTASRTAFFPLYPLGLRGISGLGLSPVLAGVLLSLGAFAAGLYALHRLTTLEAARLGLTGGREIARLAVLLTAFAPMAFYFSAVYSESLFFAVTAGAFLCARRGRWASAAVLGLLAAATRSTGVALLAPLLLLYVYGPREDGPLGRSRVDRSGALRGVTVLGSALDAFRPRYRLRADVLWLALVPAGMGLYMGHLALAGGDVLAPLHAEAAWSRHFAGPYGAVWDGAKAAFQGLRQLLSFQRHHVYYPAAGGSPFINAGHNLLLFAFLVAGIPALLGTLKLLPPAYGVYVLVSLALPLSYPVAPQPLMSLPRFLVVLFPLSMWLAVRLTERPRALTRAVLIASGLAMAFFAGQFSTWHWVA